MEFDNAFEVPLPVAEAWKVLIDIPRIAPCMPGAELSEVIDDRTYRGRIAARLGPVALGFAGTVAFQEVNEAAHSATLAAQGSDTKGRGGANAVATFRLEPIAGGSKVLVHTDLRLSGAVAQYGRGVGIIQLTAAQIITQFANNLKAQLAQDAVPPPPLVGKGGEVALSQAQTRAEAPSHGTSAPATKPISAFALFAKVLWQAIKRLFSGA
jgi:uncharacterized protein